MHQEHIETYIFFYSELIDLIYSLPVNLILHLGLVLRLSTDKTTTTKTETTKTLVQSKDPTRYSNTLSPLL